ncbi:MAG: hypothetical protein OXR62_02255 [Ahrensia sp.]|nr:hypothetical protein [Ahrensia sp.]
MMRRFFTLWAMGVWFVFATSAAVAKVDRIDSEDPTELLAVLAQVQDDVAQNGAAAIELQTFLLERIEGIFQDRSATDLSVLMVTEYALSGGNPSTALRLFRLMPDGAPHQDVALAMRPYLRGRSETARDRFEKLDMKSVPVRLRALLILAQGMLKSALDDPTSIRELRQAKMMMPGTLVEEAASRRLVEIYAQQGETDKVMRVAAQYWQRFPRSPYRKQMEKLVADQMIIDDSEETRQWAKRLAGLSNFERLAAFAAQLARASIFAGNSDLADFATSLIPTSKEAERLATTKRSRLMREISRLTSEDVKDVAKRLESFDTNGLLASDRRLLQASRGIARAIKAPLRKVDASDVDPEAESEADPFMQRMREKLEAVEDTLSKESS